MRSLSKIALISIVFVLFGASGVVAEEEDLSAPQKPQARRCRIVITMIFKSGKTEENSFYTNAKTKEQCIRDADAHKTNFAPHLVKEKRVRTEWNRP